MASKGIRSYFANANGLRGFVMPFSITKYFRRPHQQNKILEVTKHQQIDMRAIVDLLDKMKTNEERFEYLSTWYPCLHIFVLQKRGMVEELRAFDEKCKSYEKDKDPSKFSLYVHGHWL